MMTPITPAFVRTLAGDTYATRRGATPAAVRSGSILTS